MKRFSFRPGRRFISSLADLSRIERLLLEHVTRYRITTRRGWRGAWELRDFEHERIARSVRRLVAQGILRRRILYGSIHCFELDVLGTQLMKLPPERGKQFSPEARYRAYAQLLYATTGTKRLVLATRSDICRTPVDTGADTSAHPFAGTGWGFFFDPEDAGNWIQLLVDRSLHTNPNRIAQRLRETSIRLGNHPAWSRKLDTGKFSLAVITPSRRRAERIHHRFDRYSNEITTPLKIMVAPGLIPLAQGGDE